MPVEEASINNIMSGIENTGGVKQHNHKKKLRQRFDIIRKLGQGTFGKVQLGINKETGQEVAIKTIKKSKIETEADLVRIRREIQIMSSVQHPNIIHIYEVFENREKMVLVMEYAAGGELYDYLSEQKVLQEEEARRIFRQIATASYYCHKHKICHRDLKLENILLDENNNAKIADFGLSNVFDDHRLLNTFCGSPLYASPEIVKGTPYHGPEVDCWSLGVLLYTLVYGAMPFDGSNFKRLVKQISEGDYFEPEKPSPASPLIREMLTVNPAKRADIERICSHWWVNETYNENCLDISEDLANQTPVRLDVLLSLAPPPPQLESDKLMVTGDVAEEKKAVENTTPTRSQSVGSLMELSHPAERRIKDLLTTETGEKSSPKRKLESTVSTDRANLDTNRKDKIVKENTVADIAVRSSPEKVPGKEESEATAATPLIRNLTQTITKEMEVEEPKNGTNTTEEPQLEGAACVELIKEAELKENAKKDKIKRTTSNSLSTKFLEGINEVPSQENIQDKENKVESKEVKETPAEPKETKTPVKRKIVKKKVLTDKNENSSKPANKTEEKPKTEEAKESEAAPPAKPLEHRRSRIFEAAEKFQSLLSPTEPKPAPTFDKPKKIVIPGVSVDGFKKEFERKASLTSTSPPKLKTEPPKPVKEPSPPPKVEESPPTKEPDRTERVRNAVNIISSALDKEGTRKSKSRPCMMRKPPVPFGVSGRSASGNIAMLTNSLGPKPFVKPSIEPVATPTIQPVKLTESPTSPPEDKTSSAEITLKSATLPRRKTVKAEIQLNYPSNNTTTAPPMEFKTEMAHNVGGGRPEAMLSPKERIIPIAFEEPAPAKPPMPRPIATKSLGQRSSSLSRQSTLESDTETISSPTPSGEPIKKSPREFIIPIAVEGGGYVTPRAGSLEPETGSSATLSGKPRTSSKFGVRARRMNSLFNDRDSEDDTSPFTNLHRHSSFGKDSDSEDSRRDAFHMLRSSRAKRKPIEHTDSLSSGEEDDDDGFEILTAENLFSTLLSRVRDLTRLNVEDGVRSGFPSSRLLSHFDHGTGFFKRMDPLSRHSSLGRTFSHDRTSPAASSTSFGSAPWRRSVSRDLASDIDSVIGDSTLNHRPRGGDNMSTTKSENLNLADLDLKKLRLSEEDALALSYLTPGLSRRIQRQLFSQLPPSEARKLNRTLSSRTSDDHLSELRPDVFARRSVDRVSSTLPRRYNGTTSTKAPSLDEEPKYRSSLPRYDYSVRSASIGAEPQRTRRTTPTVKQRNQISPDSSYSESFSKYSSDSLYSTSQSEKTDLNLKKPSTGPRKISRFLRPDFYDTPKEDSVYVKEKQERELETQKVLKEIRDKRRSRLTLKREQSRERQLEEPVLEEPSKAKLEEPSKAKLEEPPKAKFEEPSKAKIEKPVSRAKFEKPVQEPKFEETIKSEKLAPEPKFEKALLETKLEEPAAQELDLSNSLLNNVSDNIKKIENNVKNGLDLTEARKDSPEPLPAPVVKRVSKIARPKSYPAEPSNSTTTSNKSSESKITRLKKGFVRQSSKEKESKVEPTKDKEDKPKNKLLQSIEKKLEKFRSPSTEKSSVDNTIRRLREQSLPRNLEPCTESGLIKRAVSVEDITGCQSAKPLQASRKSVTKILGLFKKYEEDTKKPVKKIKPKDTNGEATTAPERPRSLLLDKMRNFSSSASPTTNNVPKSKLPFRRSLNLDEAPKAGDRDSLKLDLKPPQDSAEETTYPLSPSCDDTSDTWSMCSDYPDLQSPLSPTSHASNSVVSGMYSGDENESVIDRIRRKSFYTRFNEKKRPRRATTSYKELDIYKDIATSYDYNRSGLVRRSSYGPNEKREYRTYTRSSSVSHEPTSSTNRYQAFSSRIGRPTTANNLNLINNNGCSDSEDDFGLGNSAKANRYGSLHASRLTRPSVSPSNDNYVHSITNNNNAAPTEII